MGLRDEGSVMSSRKVYRTKACATNIILFVAQSQSNLSLIPRPTLRKFFWQILGLRDEGSVMSSRKVYKTKACATNTLLFVAQSQSDLSLIPRPTLRKILGQIMGLRDQESVMSSRKVYRTKACAMNKLLFVAQSQSDLSLIPHPTLRKILCKVYSSCKV
ncbi:unnamed protein product [Prunus armeniaca]